MENYPNNSHKYKSEQREREVQLEQKRVQRVVSGKAKTKKNEVRKLTNVFISDDIHNVKSYVIDDVIIPTIKKTILNSLEMILLGKSGSYGGGSVRYADGGKVSYRKYSDDPRDDRFSGRVKAGNPAGYDDILFETRADAELAIEEMANTIKRYDIVSIGDMYDIAQITAPNTYYKYGWTSIRNAKVEKVPGGYIIRMPRALPID